MWQPTHLYADAHAVSCQSHMNVRSVIARTKSVAHEAQSCVLLFGQHMYGLCRQDLYPTPTLEWEMMEQDALVQALVSHWVITSF